MNENNNEPREMTQEELDKIVGGYVPTHPTQLQQQRVPGIQCPICGNLIPVSVHQLLFARSLQCPICGLNLFIDKKKSDKALQFLDKMDKEAQRLDK